MMLRSIFIGTIITILSVPLYLNVAQACNLRIEHQQTVINGSKFFSTFALTAYNDDADRSDVYFEYQIHYVSGSGNDLVENGIVKERVDSNNSEVWLMKILACMTLRLCLECLLETPDVITN